MTKRRGSRGPGNNKTLRVAHQNKNNTVSEYRKAQIIEDVERGVVKEGQSYQSSSLNVSASDVSPIEDGAYKRGSWEVSMDGGISMGNKRSGDVRSDSSGALCAVAHSPEYKKQKLQKVATDITSSSGSGFSSSSGAAVDRLAPEVYSPLFTMANLNLPRDRITVSAWCRNFFDLHPIVRNAISLHATYPISKLNLKCHDKKVLQFFEDMVEEMDLLTTLGDMSLEYWKLGEKIQGSSLITMADGTLKPISEIKIGDLVLTHLGNKKKVINKFKKPTNCVIEEHLKIYKLHTVGVSEPLVISGRHPVLTTSFDEVVCNTPSCKKKKVRVLPNRSSCGNCRKLNNGEDVIPQFKETTDLDVRDVVYAPFNSEVQDNLKLSKEFYYMMGFWIAEGCYCKAKSKTHVKYDGIKFTTYDKKYLNDVLKPLLKQCTSFTGTTYTSKSTHFSIGKDKYDHWLCAEKRNGPKLAQFFLKHCGEYSKEKKLSKDVMLLPPHLQAQIIAGFIDGDGCVDQSNGHIVMATSSPNLANQLVLMLRRIGCHVTISSQKANVEKNLAKKYRIKIVANEAYDVFRSLLKSEKADLLKKSKWSAPNSSLYKNWQMLTIKQKEDITDAFDEPFMYDIEVKDDHSYIANGIAIHNCFPYAELNESSGKWDRIIVQNPDYINVKKTVLSGEPIISLRPDAVLQRLAMSSNPADVQLRNKIPEKILYHVRKGQAIPLDNFNVSHLKMLSSPYNIRGTSIIVSVFKDLMLYDKLRECYSYDTEVLTERGFLKYNEILEDDKIATFNPNANELEYHNYINRTEYDFKGEAYNFIGKKIDCLVTPNHRMWLSQSKSHGGYNDFEFIKAEDVKNGYFYKSRSVVDWKGKNVKTVKVLNKEIPIEQYLTVLGHLISEGCIFSSKNKKRCDNSISTCQSELSGDFNSVKNSICNFASLMDLNVCEQKKTNTPWENKEENRSNTYNMFYWKIHNKDLMEHFKKEIGMGSHNKKIPNWVKQLSPKLLKVLLNSLVEGDGTVFKPNGIRKNSIAYAYSTVSKQLANDVQEIAFKCGFAPLLDCTKNGQGTSYYQVRWSHSINGRFPIIYGNKKDNKNGGGATIKKVKYDDKVFCFEVPNGIFVTRRNGKIAIQGNSKFAQAEDMVNPITLILVGGNTDGEYRATQEDLEYFKTMFEEATYDKNFKLVTHAGVDVKKVGSNGHILEIASDMELITKNIYTGLIVPQAVVDTESAVYASASIGLEVLRQRYFNFRNMMAKWLVNKIFAPISEINEFYEFKDGERRLIIPEVEWNKMNLYDLQDYIGNITGLVGTKQASVQTLYKSLGLNYEEEKVKMRKESIDLAIRQKEEQAMAQMSLAELQTLDPEKPILEPISDSPFEKKEVPPEAGAPIGGAEMLPELAPDPGGMLDMGGGGEGGMPSMGPAGPPPGFGGGGEI